MRTYHLGAREAYNTTPFLLVAQDRRWIKARLVIDTTTSIAHGYNFASLVMEKPSGDGASITKALDNDMCSLQGNSDAPGGLAGNE